MRRQFTDGEWEAIEAAGSSEEARLATFFRQTGQAPSSLLLSRGYLIGRAVVIHMDPHSISPLDVGSGSWRGKLKR